MATFKATTIERVTTDGRWQLVTTFTVIENSVEKLVPATQLSTVERPKDPDWRKLNAALGMPAGDFESQLFALGQFGGVETHLTQEVARKFHEELVPRLCAAGEHALRRIKGPVQ